MSSIRLHRKLIFSLLAEIFPVTTVTFLVLTSLVFVQQVGKYLNIVLSFHSSAQVASQFLLSLIPGIVIITLPVSLLLGTIITCGRLSTDGEMTAMQSLGISRKGIAIPFLIMGILGAGLTAYLSAQVAPRALKTLKGLRARILLQEANNQFSSGKFITRFPNSLLYVRDVDPQTGNWLGVFLLRKEPDSSIARLLTAESGQLIITGGDRLGFEVELNKVVAVDSKISGDSQVMEAASASTKASIKFTEQDSQNNESSTSAGPLSEMTMGEVGRLARNAESVKERLQASVEWHKRLAFPFACITLTMLTFIIAIQGRRMASRPRTTVTVLFLAMFFYLILVAGQNTAAKGNVPVWLGVWFSNLLFSGYILYAFIVSRPGFRFPLLSRFSVVIPGTQSPPQATAASSHSSYAGFDFHKLNPFNLINYLLVSEIFKYYLISTSALVLTSLVFTLFDLIPALAKTGIPFSYALSYLGYLSPQFIYQVSPFALLVGILTGYSVLSRSNQITILSGAGQSRLRLVIPMLLTVIAIGFSLWLASDSLLPFTNSEQDFRYNKIKGRQIEQTTIAFGKKWVFGKNNAIYSYQRVENDDSLINASIYYLNPGTHLLEKSVSFATATPKDNSTWLATNGWTESVNPDLTISRTSLKEKPFTVKVDEGVSIFRRTVNESSKMDSQDLRDYISQLDGVGAPTIAPKLDLKRRLAFPFSCLTLAFLAIPFAITKHARKFSPLLSVAIGVGIGLAFWLLMSLFEAAGQQESLPLDVAVWGPQILFLAIGSYLNFRQRTHG